MRIRVISRVQLQAISRWLLPIAIVLSVSSPANAQTDPARLERTVPKFDVQPIEKQLRVETPTVSSQSEARIEGTFVLSAVNIEGATIFGSAELAQSFEPYLAGQVGQTQLNQIVANITDHYRRAGYLLSYATLPKQSVQSGIIRIRVVEGFIGEVRLEGDGSSANAVRAIAEQLRLERPLRMSTLERALGLMRESPGVVVTDVRISRSAEDPARHQLTIALGANRVQALTYSDNRGTINGARIRGYSSFNLASLAVPGDQLQVDLFSIPSEDFRYFYGQVKASLPLNSSGLRLLASASRGDQYQSLPGPNQRGRSRQLIADLAYPFVKSRALSLVGHVSLGDWKSEEKRAGLKVQLDRLLVARGWLEFARVSKTRIDGRLSISRGLDLGSATEAGDVLASRLGAGAKFTKFNADVQVASALSERWQLRLDTSAQYSTKPLLAPEEFALGGSRIGRAFDFNEVTGDHGVGAMIELSYRLGDIKHGPKALEIFAFADGGGTFRKRVVPGLPDGQWLADAGAGGRFSAFGFLWSGELGIPVARADANRKFRAFFSVAKSF